MAAENADEGEGEPPVIGGSLERPSMTGHRVLEMDAIGWAIFIALLVILIPLLPLLIVLVIVLRLLGFGKPRAVSWSQPID